MESQPLPPQLAELEQRLNRRASIAPSVDLKLRIVTAAELSRQQRSAPHGWGSLQWSAAAATILVVLNISTIAASRTAVSLPRHDHVTIARYLQMLDQVEKQQNREFK